LKKKGTISILETVQQKRMVKALTILSLKLLRTRQSVISKMETTNDDIKGTV
jgi:hypothetical protein